MSFQSKAELLAQKKKLRSDLKKDAINYAAPNYYRRTVVGREIVRRLKEIFGDDLLAVAISGSAIRHRRRSTHNSDLDVYYFLDSFEECRGNFPEDRRVELLMRELQQKYNVALEIQPISSIIAKYEQEKGMSYLDFIFGKDYAKSVGTLIKTTRAGRKSSSQSKPFYRELERRPILGFPKRMVAYAKSVRQKVSGIRAINKQLRQRK